LLSIKQKKDTWIEEDSSKSLLVRMLSRKQPGKYALKINVKESKRKN
jgi:hypothetical protein